MNIPFAIREILLKDRPKSLYDISPKGTVPVLHLPNNDILEESLDIMHWALERGVQNWYQNNKTKQDKMIDLNDTEFKFWLDKYKYHVRHPDKSKNYYRKKCGSILNPYEKYLSKSSFLISNECSLVDAALFPFIRQFANVDRNWFANNFRNMDLWLNNWINNSLFNTIMLKYKQWAPGDNQTIVEFEN